MLRLLSRSIVMLSFDSNPLGRAVVVRSCATVFLPFPDYLLQLRKVDKVDSSGLGNSPAILTLERLDLMKRSSVSGSSGPSRLRHIPWLLCGLYFGLFLCGLAAPSTVAASPAVMTMPVPVDSVFLILADGRRIDAVWEWNDETGNGRFVLKESAGTEKEQPFTVQAGDTLEASLHYIPTREQLYSCLVIGLNLYRKETTLGLEGVRIETVAESKGSFLPRKTGEPLVSSPFSLAVPAELDAAVQDREHSWGLVVDFSPDESSLLLLALRVSYSSNQ